MKKLLFAASLLLGSAANFAASAGQICSMGTQVTNANVSTAISDGAVIALQCLDSNGGSYYYFNGAAVKTEEFSYGNLFKVIKLDSGNFILQNLFDESYVGTAGAASNALVTSTTAQASAMQFTSATVVTATNWNSIATGVTNGTNTVRFTTANSMYLNTNNTDVVPKWFTGTGGFSVWYVFTFSEKEIETLKAPFYLAEINSIKANAEKFTGLVSAAAKTTWNNYVATISTTPSADDVFAVRAAYEKLVNEGFDGASIQLKSKKNTEHYACAINGNGTWRPYRGSDLPDSRAWTLISNADKTGYYFKNEYTNKYFKHPSNNNAQSYLVNTTAEASIYTIDVWKTESDGSVLYGIKCTDPTLGNDQKYWHSNQYQEIWRWRADDNSSWYISSIDADEAARQHLAGALALNPQANNLGQVGYLKQDASYVTVRTAAEAATSGTATEKRTAADNLWATTINDSDIVMPQTGKIYTITSSDSRGQLIYADGKDAVWTTGKGVDEGTETNNQWTLIENDNQVFLYNLGAKKFANAFATCVRVESGTAPNCQLAWQFTEVGTPVTIDLGVFGMSANDAHPMRILGGVSTMNNRPAGMMVINALPTPVPTVAGYSGDNDGEGFRFAEVGDFTQDQLTAAEEVIESGKVAYTSLKEEVEAVKTEVGTYNEDIHGVTVGHFTPDSWNAFLDALGTGEAAVGNNHSNDYNEYHYNLALAAANAEGAIVGLKSNQTYTLTDSEGYLHHAIDGKQGKHQTKDSEKEDYYNWNCTIDETGLATFSHQHDEKTIVFALDGVTKFNVDIVGIGKVALNSIDPVMMDDLTSEEEAPAAYAPLTFTLMETQGNYTTSGLTEITAASAEAVYDLQGRRVAAPVKGINIINGKKVLVK